MIAVDAFSGDAIPLHLLTAECASIYQRRLAPGGLLLLHISNRVLNLQPVAQGLGQALGWKTSLFRSLPDGQTAESAADWVLVTADDGFLSGPAWPWQVSPWTRGAARPILWTDDFASLWHVFNF